MRALALRRQDYFETGGLRRTRFKRAGLNRAIVASQRARLAETAWRSEPTAAGVRGAGEVASLGRPKRSRIDEENTACLTDLYARDPSRPRRWRGVESDAIANESRPRQ